MDMSESDYRANLRAYLGQWAPDMDAEALTAYVDDADVSSEGRLALSEDLQLTHGQSLDDYYITNVRQRAAALRSALREAGAGTAYPVLLEHGVESLGALMDMDPALLEELFPDPAIRAAVANLANPL